MQVSMSIETRSFNANAIALSAVNGVATVNALYAIVGFTVNAVVQPMLMSMTVFHDVDATVPTESSAPMTRYGSSAYHAFATSVPVVPIVQAIAKFTMNLSIAIYLKVHASGVASILSPMIVIVVFGAPYVDGIETIPT